MIGRWLFRLLLVSVAVLAALVQLDQQAGRDPAYAALVPPAFSANAARARTGAALQAGQGEAALAEARQQLSLRPLPAEGLTLLSLAALGADERQLALASLDAASRRGWREPISQLASGEAALQQGQHAIAAQRAAALFATGSFPDQALGLLARLLATEQGRAAFATQLARPGHWQTNTLAGATAAVPPEQWADTIARAQALGADLPCARLRQLAESYRGAGEDEALARFWPGGCPES